MATIESNKYNYDKEKSDLKENKADKSELDGEWHAGVTIVKNGQVLIDTAGLQFDLSNYLPNDGCAYELLIDAYMTGTIKSENIEILGNVGYLKMNSSIKQTQGAIILSENSRVIRVIATTGGTNTLGWLSIMGYRRIGTNKFQKNLES